MEMTQEWIDQYNRKCAVFLGWKETTDEFKIEWIGCKTKERLDRINKQYVPILEKNGDVLFPDFSVMDFTKDWYWIMEVVEKIGEIKNTQFDIFPTYSRISHKGQYFETSSKSRKEAVLKSIDQFIDWYNKQKEL